MLDCNGTHFLFDDRSFWLALDCLLLFAGRFHVTLRSFRFLCVDFRCFSSELLIVFHFNFFLPLLYLKRWSTCIIFQLLLLIIKASFIPCIFLILLKFRVIYKCGFTEWRAFSVHLLRMIEIGQFIQVLINFHIGSIRVDEDFLRLLLHSLFHWLLQTACLRDLHTADGAFLTSKKLSWRLQLIDFETLLLPIIFATDRDIGPTVFLWELCNIVHRHLESRRNRNWLLVHTGLWRAHQFNLSDLWTLVRKQLSVIIIHFILSLFIHGIIDSIKMKGNALNIWQVSPLKLSHLLRCNKIFEHGYLLDVVGRFETLLLGQGIHLLLDVPLEKNGVHEDLLKPSGLHAYLVVVVSSSQFG